MKVICCRYWALVLIILFLLNFRVFWTRQISLKSSDCGKSPIFSCFALEIFVTVHRVFINLVVWGWVFLRDFCYKIRTLIYFKRNALCHVWNSFLLSRYQDFILLTILIKLILNFYFNWSQFFHYLQAINLLMNFLLVIWTGWIFQFFDWNLKICFW